MGTMPKKKKKWIPASTLKVTKLKPAGPKDGQSTASYMFGKEIQNEVWNEKMGGGSSYQTERGNFGRI